MTARLYYHNQKYCWDGSFATKELPKRARFRWNPNQKIWWTDDPKKAAKLVKYADGSCRAELARLAAEAEERKALSQAATDELVKREVPVPAGLEYLPYQKAGIAYALARPSSLIADEMGLGKTVQALGVANGDPTLSRILIVCPASLRLNWAREAKKWLVAPRAVHVIEGGKPEAWPTQVEREAVVVINYDVVKKHLKQIQSIGWDLLIVDEAHYCKNQRAVRTQVVVGDGKKKEGLKARRRVFLTGTPVLNRPIEIWPLIRSLDPDTWRSFWTFAKRYCAAYQDEWAWHFDGAQNLSELQEKLRESVMVRRLKVDVLPELPPKRRQVISIPANGEAKMVQRERDIFSRHDVRLEELRTKLEELKAGLFDAEEIDLELEIAGVQEAIKEGAKVAFEELAELRHSIAQAKAPKVAEHLMNAGGKVVCFAWHKDVIQTIREALEKAGEQAVVVTGDTPMEARQEAVDAFQRDDGVRFFLGNIRAAGVGLTLTAASHVVFAELDWVPANMTQAEDRCHRIGQGAESVLIQHVVLEGSLDENMAEALVEKQRIFDEAMDGELPVIPELPAEADRAAGAGKSADRIGQLAEKMTENQRAAAHHALRALAGMCDGATTEDGRGFNKFDTRIGKKLAAEDTLTPRQAAYGALIAKKYWRQFPEALRQEIQGVGK